ncbi:MAG: alpha/beta hydrolase, partial [Acidimicrobiaceae bacterium]|nr:alpha/beta hydrolase [Acidimicrobiaceae bacterium]
MQRDESVTSAIANWGPRFTAQGVDPNDFVRVTEPVHQWADWLDAWCANADLHAGLAREAETLGHSRTAGFAWLRAALSYHFAKFVWMLDMDRHRRAADASVAAMRAAHGHLDPTAERVEVTYEDGTIYGNLRRPADAARPPLVLLIAGLDSTKEEFFHVEEVYLRRGMATFSFDGPGQGESGYTTHIRPDYEVAVSAVLDRLCGRDDLDGERVGALGVSLGGYYVVRATAFEPRLRAAVACGGAYDYGEVIAKRPPNSRATFAHYSGTAGGDETVDFGRRMTLAGVAEKVHQPLLVVAGKRDRLVPWQDAERVAQEAPDAKLWMFDEGNHVCMNMVYRWR